MTTGVFWCERDERWVRFSKNKSRVKVEIATISSENPRLTNEWLEVKSGSWQFNYKSDSNIAISTSYVLSKGKVYEGAGFSDHENFVLRPFSDLPLTPEMKKEKWKKYQNSDLHGLGMKEVVKSDHYFSQNIQEQLFEFIKTVLYALDFKGFNEIADYIYTLEDIVENKENPLHQAIIREAARTELDQLISKDTDANLQSSHYMQKQSFLFKILKEEIKILAKEFGIASILLNEISYREQEVKIIEADNGFSFIDEEINPDMNQLDLIKRAVQTAQTNYKNWYEGTNSMRGPDRFFSRCEFRHGVFGQTRAFDLNTLISTSDNFESAVFLINNFLTDNSTNFNRHSFASFVLDELKIIPNSVWSQIHCDRTTSLYDKATLTTNSLPGFKAS
ncbi:MAG: hypothetical protein H0U70_05945 [Tatlockia sp.]|nr:hypothetical protein [Tatlockia sp.]